jgi:hypothetical protein
MTKQELQQLRQQITLNSLYTSDYENSFNIDPRQVQDFFDGWLEYCSEDIEYTNDTDYYNQLFDKADNIDNLVDYYIYMFEEDPLSLEFFEKYYK